MTTTEAPTGRTKARTDITYYHDGRPMPGSHKHKLSTLAYFHSGGIDPLTCLPSPSAPKRLATKQFVTVLEGLGVADPGAPGWMVTLPNGVTVECRADGEKAEFDGPAPTRKSSTATKATTPTPRNAKGQIQSKKPAKSAARVRKETAKARATTKKAPAKKATATPIPKGQPAKRRSTRAN